MECHNIGSAIYTLRRKRTQVINQQLYMLLTDILEIEKEDKFVKLSLRRDTELYESGQMMITIVQVVPFCILKMKYHL